MGLFSLSLCVWCLAIRRKENGWYDEEHPLVFLFLGSSGIGTFFLRHTPLFNLGLILCKKQLGGAEINTILVFLPKLFNAFEVNSIHLWIKESLNKEYSIIKPTA